MYALGLHVEDKTVKVALLHRGKKGIEIDLLRSFALEGQEGVKPLYMLSSILADKVYAVVTGLDASDVLLRETALKLRRKGAILAALPFQVGGAHPLCARRNSFTAFSQAPRQNDDGCVARCDLALCTRKALGRL